ncbi:hypothetical protein JCM6882_000668 [Rhodosporidiobolus microsporus]
MPRRYPGRDARLPSPSRVWRRRREDSDMSPVRLYLGHLAVGTSERDIKRLFAQEDVSVLDVSLFTRYEPCFAFCTVASPTEASHALRFLDSSILNSSRIQVNRVTHVKGSSTLPRVVVEGLPAEFETLDVLRLAEEHAAEPRRVKCEVAAAGRERGERGECVGSFRVEGKEEAERAVRSLKKALGMYEQIRVWWDYGEAKDEPPRTPPRGNGEGGKGGDFVDDCRHDRPPLPPPPPPSFTYSSSPSSSRGGWSRDGMVHGAGYGSGVGAREGRDAEWAASRYGGGWNARGGEKGPEWAR